MKRMIRALVVAAALAVTMTCTAFAATDGYTTGSVDHDAGTYSATCTGAIPGNQYVLLVVEGTQDNYTIGEDTILYIDQTAADANGKVSFTGFIPKEITDAVVLLGGQFNGQTSPVVLGTIQSIEPEYTLGDVSNDGNIRVNDARLTLQIALGKVTPTEIQFKAADVSGDGNVRVNDARLILQYSLGKITEF